MHAGGGDKRLAGETKDGWLDENQFAILALEVRELSGILAERRMVVREQAIALNFQPRPALGKRSSRTFVPRENRRHGMAWRGGIEYFIMANDRFINSNLSAIKSRPPSIPLHMKGRTTLRLLGRVVEEEGGVTRDSWRETDRSRICERNE